MKLIEAKQFVISRLRGLPVCDPNSSMTQWVVRCPYCPDSLTPTHGHFSIKIDEHSDELMLYRCLKCNESGLLSSQTLDDLGIYLTQEEAAELDRANRGGKSNYWNEKPKNYFIPPPISPVNLELKLQYLESRFGFRMTDQMIQESKVVLSIIDFLSANKISLGQFSPYIIKSLENHYIGFLSSNNNRIVFRYAGDIPKGSKILRYYKMVLDERNLSPNTFYSIQRPSIPLLYDGKVHLHISEGTFDIISAYYNLKPSWDVDKDYHFFFGSCGFSIAPVVRWILSRGITTDVILDYYADNDKSDQEVQKIIRTPVIREWCDEIYLHRNKFGTNKDFGVPACEIDERIRQIK